MPLVVAELELLASLVDKYFIMLLRNEPFSVGAGGGARVVLLELLLLVLLLLLLLACLGVGSPFVFTTAAASFSSVRLPTSE